VRNFYNMLFGNAACTPNYSPLNTACVDTGGTTRSNINYICTVDGYGYAIQGYNAGLGDYARGIQVGSGDLAWDFEQYSLHTLIVHGTGSGQLSYQECERILTETVGMTKRTTWRRFLNNNSGAAITVAEIGLVARAYIGSWYNFLFSRDVLAPSINVPDAGQLRVQYIIELTYPA